MLEYNRQREPRHGPNKRRSLDRIARQIAAEIEVSVSTVWRWYCRFKLGGYAALAHTRRDRGCPRYLPKHPDVDLMIRSRISLGRSAYSVWKSLAAILGCDAPSYGVVLARMKQLPTQTKGCHHREWNSEGRMADWVSREDVMAVTDWTARMVQRKVAAGSLDARAAGPAKQEPNGRPVLEYSVASLPLDAQMKLLERSRTSAKESEALAIAGGEPPQLDAQTATPKVALLPEGEAQARERYAVIEPLIHFEREQRAAPHGQLHLDLGLKLPDGTPVTTFTQMCLYLADKHKKGRATLLRWLARWREGGLPALADRTRSDKDTSRFFAKHPKAATLAAYLFLEQRQSVRAAHEAIQRDCLSLGITPRELPDYETVRAFLKGPAFSEPLKILAREGQRVYRERCAPYVSRGYTDVGSNEIWVSDHMIHDVEVQNDCFLDAEWGTPIRLCFTAILDFRARFVAGCSWAWEGSSRSITTALRRAVTAHGPAEVFYCDNGQGLFEGGARGRACLFARQRCNSHSVVRAGDGRNRRVGSAGAARDERAALHRPPSAIEARRALLRHRASAARQEVPHLCGRIPGSAPRLRHRGHGRASQVAAHGLARYVAAPAGEHVYPHGAGVD